MKKIVVADDHPIILQGMQLMLKDSTEYKIVNTASTMDELISVCSSECPDLVILDINLKGKNSLDKLESFSARFSRCKVIVFSSYNNHKLVNKAMQLNADGYVLKDAAYSEWMDALEDVFNGKKYLSKEVRKKRIKLEEKGLDQDNFSLKSRISNQENNIIQCIVEGKKEQEIADILHISKNTVHTHKKNILKKLALHSNAELVKFAYENHLVS